MTGQPNRTDDVREQAGLPERRLTIRAGNDVRRLSLTPRMQLLGAAAIVGLLGWTGYATVSGFVAATERDALAARVAQLETGAVNVGAEVESRHAQALAELASDSHARIQTLIEDRDAARRSAEDALGKLAVMTRELARRQSRLVEAADSEAELSAALDSLRGKLADAVAERDAAQRRQTELARQVAELSRETGAEDQAEAEWTASIAEVTAALEQTTEERDAAALLQAALRERLATMEADQARAEEARSRLFAQLEDAVQAGLGGLESMFEKVGVDPERVVAEMRRDYSGEGGPFIPVDETPTPDLISADAQRVASLLGGLERASLMQVAAAKMPVAKPVRAGFRFTSGFGVRKDPKNGRMRMHAGVDFASDVGTPIYSAADGVVVFSGWQSGYGRVVKIRHAFGFETVYGHLNAARVKVGDRVAREDRIGDMGRTGRVTGPHLHYEIRLNGKPVNPMKYVEAARNVL
ncbi:DUF5930 domain-containing protein [Albimonas sp. CAU 1670]|uniref:DUF5930 domain-containing protein n=1 Tax=Albimonas sp. CAU 1670 TaxID=3032599 RepID=UPI0023DBC6BE|nr:DUF5930 domain-containing protein [Albimonas sp. CAU 1670]MDF2232542.1 DUF5930 domain-containing protein [Albimonas sp. CAU 1670]